MARSSTKSEYYANTTTVTELEWVKNMMSELGILLSHLMILKSDTKGSTFLAANQACHTKPKHVSTNLQYVRERVETGSMIVQHIPSVDQRVDILTKSLSPKLFLEQRFNLVEVLPQN